MHVFSSCTTAIMYRIRPEFVQDCFWSIADYPFHRHLAGYFGLKRCVQIEHDRQDQPYLPINGVEFDYSGYFKAFHKVREGDKPYLLPFKKTDATPENVWLNQNVAGTYAPSSVRDGQPFDRVVDIDNSGGNSLYVLKSNHAKIAKEELCDNQPIPVDLLAAFFYRDFGIMTEATPTKEDVVSIFKYEFGYRDNIEAQSEEFDELFEFSDVSWEDAFYGVEA